MIRPLRTRHRRMFLILAVLLPLLFVAGLMSRDQQPVRLIIPAAGGGR